MLRILKTRFKQGKQTQKIASTITAAQRFRGLPKFQPEKCNDACTLCADKCGTSALMHKKLNLGLCTFCGECTKFCPNGAIDFSNCVQLAVRNKEDLILDEGEYKLAHALEKKD